MLFRPPHDVRPRLVLQLPGVANEADAIAGGDLGVADLPDPQASRKQKQKEKWNPASCRYLACLTRRSLFHELPDPYLLPGLSADVAWRPDGRQIVGCRRFCVKIARQRR